MAYATAENVRLITNLSTNDISDEDISKIIKTFVTPDINKEISVYEEDEEVEFIDNEKENDIDGSNTTFYTRHFPIGDLNDDGTVDTSDIEAYTLASDGTRTSVTVSSIDNVKLGKFTLSSAPDSDVRLVLRYRWVPLGINVSTPDPIIRKAASELAAAIVYVKIQPQLLKQLDSIDVVAMPVTSDQYMTKYKETLKQLKDRMAESIEGDGLPSIESVS